MAGSILLAYKRRIRSPVPFVSASSHFTVRQASSSILLYNKFPHFFFFTECDETGMKRRFL